MCACDRECVTVAPQTAARIREFVNSDPKWSKIIQFNTLAGVAAMNALGAATSEPVRARLVALAGFCRNRMASFDGIRVAAAI
jgi:hypothetical protein